MKKVNVMYASPKNIELTSLTDLIKAMELAEIVVHKDIRSMYDHSVHHKDEKYVAGKIFGHSTGCNECNNFSKLLRAGTYENMYFIEKPPFRFKQGVNDRLNNKLSGVMLNRVCSFANEWTLSKYMEANYNANEIKIRVEKFRKYWLTKNKEEDNFEHKKEYVVYFPLQLPQDASIQLTGNTYPMNEMIRTVFGCMKRIRDDFVIVIREHPYHKNNYKYDLGTIDARIIMTNEIPHHTLITNADVVVSYNSSSLAEAVLNRKKVLYFKNLPSVNAPGIGYHIPAWSYFDATFLNYAAYMMNYYLKQPINQYQYDKYVYFITNELSFFPGFHSEDEICEWIKRKLELD